MNTDQHFYEKNCYSIDTTNNNVIYQPSQEIHQHQVEKGWLILSKNDFSKVKKRINLGIFNKKTNFLIGEKSSLMFWDNEKHELTHIDTTVALEEPTRYFMIYDMNFVTEDTNSKLDIYDKKTKKNTTLLLNKQLGLDIGEFLNRATPDKIEIPEEFQIIRSIIQIKDSRISLNKQVLINSNHEFLLGILEGYIQDKNYFSLKNNINIYNITYILNLLGAQYSIRSVENGEKHIRFKLPIFLKKLSQLPEVFFRRYKYMFKEKHLALKKDIIDLRIDSEDTSMFGLVNSGLIEMISLKDLVFLPVENQVMYDLTMTNADAANFSLPGTPTLKNSDGDILGAIAIFSRDAAEEAIRKFSTELKENFLNLTTGKVNNWGVKLDSQLGLYSATI